MQKIKEGIEVSPSTVLNLANEKSDFIKSAYNAIRNSRSELIDIDDEAVLIKPIMIAGLASLNLDT